MSLNVRNVEKQPAAEKNSAMNVASSLTLFALSAVKNGVFISITDFVRAVDTILKKYSLRSC